MLGTQTLVRRVLLAALCSALLITLAPPRVASAFPTDPQQATCSAKTALAQGPVAPQLRGSPNMPAFLWLGIPGPACATGRVDCPEQPNPFYTCFFQITVAAQSVVGRAEGVAVLQGLYHGIWYTLSTRDANGFPSGNLLTTQCGQGSAGSLNQTCLASAAYPSVYTDIEGLRAACYWPASSAADISISDTLTCAIKFHHVELGVFD
jgi:hypothetical protein